MKNKRFYFTFLALLFIVGAALTGCTSAPSENASEGTSNSKDSSSKSDSNDAEGGELIIAVLSDATQLDPHKGTDIPSANVYHGKIYEGLVKQDENMDIQPALATEWKKVDDLTWEFKLREGVKFHDGTDFTAEDVKKTLERIKANQS